MFEIPNLDPSKFDSAIQMYEKMRLPRTTSMLAASQALGDMQLSRGNDPDDVVLKKEKEIRRVVDEFGNMPVLIAGSGYDYQIEVDRELQRSKL